MYPQPLIAPGTAHISGTGNIFDSNSLYQPLMYPSSVHASPFQQSRSREGGYRNIPIRELSSISDQSPNKATESIHNDAQNHPFKGPKLHLFKKGNSRRIKTSSAARNLQPIYPLDSSKIVYNFNSINAGGTIQNENDSSYISSSKQSKLDFDQQNQYTTLTNTKTYQQSSILQSGKRQPYQDINGTIDIYSNEGGQTYGNYSNSSRDQMNINSKMRPNTTSLDQLESQESPKRQLINLTNLNMNQPKNQVSGLSKLELQEEINGFKHSFYNDKSALTPTNKVKQEKQATEKVDSARQIEKMKEQIHQNSEVIKHIFVLNVGANNLGTNQQSTQESKAMTPCFIHTPNMTNKWGNFKADSSDQIIVQEGNEKLFIKDNKIKGIPQTKKPLTSHQSKNQSMNGSTNLKQKQHDFTKLIGQESIQLGPEDIYLTNGSKSHKNTTSQNQKGQVIGPFRIPLSRNQGITTDHASSQKKNNSNFTIATQEAKPSSKKGVGMIKVKLSGLKNLSTEKTAKGLIKEQENEEDEGLNSQSRES